MALIRWHVAAAAAVVLVVAGLAGAAKAAENKFEIRVRALSVVPDEDADISQIGGDVSIDTSVVPEFDLSYFITDHISVEVIAAITPHEITAKNNPVGTIDLGGVWLLPPTVTLQYHMNPHGVYDPYVGAGINYTHFFGANEPAGFDIEYDDSVGFALQAGIDIRVKENTYLNLDVKKVFINTEATIRNPLTVTPIKADVDIDPWIIGVGVGIRF
ncbi:MAG: OmpW family protein [Alphaproteobacteria bacterium]|nr:OmpW family protein [Alphaproteobacteria bacterium]